MRKKSNKVSLCFFGTQPAADDESQEEWVSLTSRTGSSNSVWAVLASSSILFQLNGVQGDFDRSVKSSVAPSGSIRLVVTPLFRQRSFSSGS